MYKSVLMLLVFTGWPSLSRAQASVTPEPSTKAPAFLAARVAHVGGSVTAPVLLHSVEPDFSGLDKKAHGGSVQIYLWVDINGNPSHVLVIRGLGAGFDEKAVQAIRQYKFKPAMQDGKPIMVDLYIDVNVDPF